MDDDKPHIAFTMTGDRIAEALTTLGVAAPPTARNATGHHSGWPGQEQWASYMGGTSEWLHGLLPDDERHRIEAKLSSLETDYNNWLHASQGGASAGRIDDLRGLGASVREAEGLICQGGSHATLPYVVRWFMLEFAVMNALAEREAATHADQLAAVQMWWRCRDYLQRAFQSAYAARAGKITVRVTGALRDRIYVHDALSDQPLTFDVAAGGQGDIEIRQVSRYLASAAAWDYIGRIKLEDGATVLALARSAILVTPQSLTRQDQLVDPLNFWTSLRESIETEIEVGRTACGSALDRLVVPRLPMETPSVPATRSVEPRDLARAGDKPEYWEMLESAVPGFIGMIPVVGPALSVIMTSFLQFIGARIFPAQPDPFIEFGRKMEMLMHDKIGAFDAGLTANLLKDISGIAHHLVRDYAARKGKASPSELNEFKARVIGLITQIQTLRSRIITPASGSPYHVAPHYMHYFTLYLMAFDLAQTMGVTSYDYRFYRKTLYEETNVFVREAIHGIANERAGQIRLKNTSNGCSSEKIHVMDTRRDMALSSNLNINGMWEGLRTNAATACQEAAGLASAMQVMRSMTREMDGVMLKDTAIVNMSPSGIRPTTIADTYFNAITQHADAMKPSYRGLALFGKADLLAPAVAVFYAPSREQCRYFEVNPPFPSLDNDLLIRLADGSTRP